MKPERLKQLFPNASKSTIDANSDSNSSSPDAIMERSSGDGPLAAAQAKESDSGIYIVRVTSFRVRLLDDDNVCEKFHVDCCRYAGLLPSDAYGKARIIPLQKKVDTKAQQKTLIEIVHSSSGLGNNSW